MPGDSGDFDARMQHLIDSAGVGVLTAEVTVDQVYAKYQELRDDLRIHLEGQHHYLRDSLFEQSDDVMREWADGLVTADGSDIRSATGRNAERVSQGVFERAPLEFGDLKASGHPVAYDNGAVIYNRPPMVPRLSEAELEAKGDVRRLGFGNTAAMRAALGGSG